MIDLPTFVSAILADKTSIIITNSNSSEFKKNINNVSIRKKNNWFKSNLLSLYFDKAHFLQLITKNNQENYMQILHENK
jgi:hypothetical protein